MTSPIRRNARFLELAARQAKCNHKWHTYSTCGDIIFRHCVKCALEEEKDIG